VSLAGWSKGLVRKRVLWTQNLLTLTIEAEIERFKPGQFVNLALEQSGEWVRRSYSLASAPGSLLEFYLARVTEGALTPRLFELPEGAELWVEKKPQGFFSLDYVPDARVLWCLATGTGLGPFISMFRAGEMWQRFDHVVLVHGVRQRDHLSYGAELATYASAHPGKFRVVPVISREHAPDALHGRIGTVLTSGELEARAGHAVSPDSSHVMLCGNPAMIHDVTELLKARGLRRHRLRAPGHISTEKYWEPDQTRP
jgi:ferredoxin/flavodoxin---NADP+ reductase